MSAARLEARGVQVALGPGRPAVDGLDLDLACGTLTVLLGPSGAGKSTLLRAIAGLERVRAGAIAFDGALWSGPGVHLAPEKRRCGVVFQDYALFPHLNAIDNAAFGLREGARAARRAAAFEALERLGLKARARAYPHELSGGEQQRVALARALAPGPDVLLLDEPFASLDPGLRAKVRARAVDALKAAGVAALLITHDAEEALALADRLALMAEGRILQAGEPERLYLNPVSETAARLLGPVEVFEALVKDGAAQTPLGAIPAAGLPEGAAVRALVRPEGIVIGPPDGDGPSALVVERRLAAGAVRLTLGLKTGRRLAARAPLLAPFRAGDVVTVSLDRRLATVLRAP